MLNGVLFYCSEYKIKAFVQLNIKMSQYQYIVNEYAIIQALR